MAEKSVGIVILAAGGSTRLGSPKQLLRFRGRSLLLHACETALASLCRPVIVVLGAESALLRQEIANLPVQVVENANWRDGMGTSIRTGVNAIAAHKNPSAVVLMLCDQPLLSAQHLDELVRLHRESGKGIVASRYSDTFGVPALFSREFFVELQQLPPYAGAKSIIKRHADAVCGVTFENGTIDIDTSQDYAMLKLLENNF